MQVTYSYKDDSYDLYDYLALNHVTGLLILKDGKPAALMKISAFVTF